jgi:uncharacterized protein with NRDE domain
MCLILLAWQAHPRYPLVVAANRDEFFARPTAAATFWPESPRLLAGRDLQDGGTWLGITRQGRFAALTNFRDPGAQRKAVASRGLLTRDFLVGEASPSTYVDTVALTAAGYNGFNLLIGDMGELVWFSNVSGERRTLTPGIYGISNHLLDTPWPKVTAAKSSLAQALVALPDDGEIFRLLRDDSIHPDDALPRTGVSLDWERLLSAAFVTGPGYGTRCSTLILVGADGWASFQEQTWLEGGLPGQRQHYRFRIDHDTDSTL